ncbi:MAG: hypothetical protein IJR47_01940 [Clostridia bacterium]|nr:hypothetical protein [Clostridia bacterium]
MKSQFKRALTIFLAVCLVAGLAACKKESKKKKSKFLGTWDLEYANMGDTVVTPSELNMSMTIVIDESGSTTITLVQNDTTDSSIGKWEDIENGVRILEANGEVEVFRMTEIEGRLQTQQDSIILIFAKQE